MAIGVACSLDVGTGIGDVVDRGMFVFAFLLMLGESGFTSVVGCSTGDGDYRVAENQRAIMSGGATVLTLDKARLDMAASFLGYTSSGKSDRLTFSTTMPI